MPTVVTGNCEDCRYTECVTVCPVSCFHGDDRMLYINQDVCIDCKACIPVCPVEAISDADDATDDLQAWLVLNTDRAPLLPRIESKLPLLATADEKKAGLGF